MCGICGAYNFRGSAPVNKQLLQKATDIIEHRGPDAEGFYYDDERGVGFGHRRLSILDLETGEQPMSNEDGSVWIAFNGEIYNYKDLIPDLKNKGHIFKTKSDTETIIHGYEEYGPDFVKRLNGIFAFAIWEKNKKRLFVARDHFGIKPLYYYADETTFVFGSEMKSILAYRNPSRELDSRALYLNFVFRHTPSPYTLFKSINKLPAAHYLLLEEGKEPVIKGYWDYSMDIDNSKSEEEWIEILRHKTELAVERQMVADVPVGISLSGGLDSGAVLSLMHKYGGDGLHAFTIGFEDNDAIDDESERAKANAALFKANYHYKLVTSKDYQDFMSKYIWHLEEPIGNESAVAYYFVAEMAKGTVKVLLNGQGADEPYAGYDRYIGMHYGEKIPGFALEAASAFSGILPVGPLRKKQLQLLRNYKQRGSDIEKITGAAGILTFAERKNLLGEELFAFEKSNTDFDEVNKFSALLGNGEPAEKMLVYDMFTSLSENLLLCEDKMAMAASIEARVPFLDVELAVQALKVPLSYKIKGKSGKYIHKKVCEKYLPSDIIYQRKIGFNNPFNKWLKGHIGNELMDLVKSSNSISSRYLNSAGIEQMYKRHLAQTEDQSKFFYLLLSMEKWNNTFAGGTF